MTGTGACSPTTPTSAASIRKTLPLAEELEGFAAWITGRKRFQGGLRRTLETIELRKRDRAVQAEPAGDLGRGPDRDLPRRARPAGASAARPGLPLDRLRLLHPADRPRRAGPRRTLVRHRQDRVRHPPAGALRRQHMSRGNLALRLPDGAPFAASERAALDNILGRASGEQRAWLAGFLAGLAARDEAAAGPGRRPAGRSGGRAAADPLRHGIRQRRGGGGQAGRRGPAPGLQGDAQGRGRQQPGRGGEGQEPAARRRHLGRGRASLARRRLLPRAHGGGCPAPGAGAVRRAGAGRPRLRQFLLDRPRARRAARGARRHARGDAGRLRPRFRQARPRPGASRCWRRCGRPSRRRPVRRSSTSSSRHRRPPSRPGRASGRSRPRCWSMST